jgi:hypothetical protein
MIRRAERSETVARLRRDNRKAREGGKASSGGLSSFVTIGEDLL